MACVLDAATQQIMQLRRTGMGWSDIGRIVGLSRDAARRRWEKGGVLTPSDVELLPYEPTTLLPVLFVPDAHIPYHHTAGWTLMLMAAADLKPHTICVIGDLADFFGVSDHLKDPRRARQLEQEVAEVNSALDQLDSLGAQRKIFVEGNHEDRLRRYLEAKAPELFGFVDVPSLFSLDRRGWEYVPYHEYTRIGKLFVTHDVGAAGKYAVYQCLATYEHSIVTGHTHRLAYIVEGNAVGEYKVSAQFGWLGDVDQVDYMHRAKAKKDWALGFGVGSLDPSTGYVYLTPVPIVNGSCVVNSKLYTVHEAT